MTFQPTILTGGRLHGVPRPRRLVQNLMLATATAAHDEVDTDPGRLDPMLEGCFVLRQSGLAVAGTGCRRPLLLREFSSACEATGRNGLIVRLSDDVDAAKSTYDVKFAGAQRMLCGYRLWLSDLGAGSAWLIPTVGDGPYVMLGTNGLNLHGLPPFDDDWQRQSGLVCGGALLTLAGKGWF